MTKVSWQIFLEAMELIDKNWHIAEEKNAEGSDQVLSEIHVESFITF
jgi:hypothetical protein